MLCTIDWMAVSSWAQATILFLGFLLTLLQLRSSSNDSRAKFWLEIKTHFYRFEDVTSALRPDGKWENEIPPNAESWSRIDEYLGMFEYCEMLLKRKIIDEDFFIVSYKVQLFNAMNHHQIIRKVMNPDEVEYWKTLLELCKRLGIVIKSA